MPSDDPWLRRYPPGFPWCQLSAGEFPGCGSRWPLASQHQQRHASNPSSRVATGPQDWACPLCSDPHPCRTQLPMTKPIRRWILARELLHRDDRRRSKEQRLPLWPDRRQAGRHGMGAALSSLESVMHLAVRKLRDQGQGEVNTVMTSFSSAPAGITQRTLTGDRNSWPGVGIHSNMVCEPLEESVLGLPASGWYVAAPGWLT